MKSYTGKMAARNVDLMELQSKEKAEQEALSKLIASWKVGFFDVETTGLSGDIGHLLCSAILDQNNILTTFRRDSAGDEPGEDEKLIRVINTALSDYDMIVTFYGHNFDWKMLESRLARIGFKGTAQPLHIDLYYHGKRLFNLHNGRLETLARHLKVRVRKTHLDWDIWNKADHGNTKSLDYVVDHCAHDVYMLRDCFIKMKHRIGQVWRR